MKLVNAASFIYHQHTVTATKLTFLSAPVNYARLMQVPLIPAETLNADANLVIKMVIGTDIDIGQGESDPSYVISDGQFFVGVHIRDKNNYKTSTPCTAETLLVVIVVLVRICRSLPSLITREGSRPS